MYVQTSPKNSHALKKVHCILNYCTKYYEIKLFIWSPEIWQTSFGARTEGIVEESGFKVVLCFLISQMLDIPVGMCLSLGYLWYVPVHLKALIYFFGTVEIFTKRSSLQKEKVLIYCNSSNIFVRHRPDTYTIILCQQT